MPGGRPPGPLRNYTVSGAWPSSPSRFRHTVVGADERTARTSSWALSQMHCAVRIEISFHTPGPGRELQGSCVAAQWNKDGSVAFRHTGPFAKYIPAWVIAGRESAEKEQAGEPAAAVES